MLNSTGIQMRAQNRSCSAAPQEKNMNFLESLGVCHSCLINKGKILLELDAK